MLVTPCIDTRITSVALKEILLNHYIFPNITMKSYTPICDFVRNYAEQKYTRLHMPGHKGKDFVGCEKCDITEIVGADSLYEANGIIAESEENATELFGTGATLYSAEGSSLCIRAMLYLTRQSIAEKTGRKPLIAATRNAHKVFALTVALLDIDVFWLDNGSKRSSLCDCLVTPESLDKALAEMRYPPDAVFVTSPDYLGNIADIKGLTEVAHKYGSLLICDNAHGAYLKFTEGNRHPIDNGADMCCDSAHKTLPALTGGAYLHVNKTAPVFLKENARDAMAMFGSTSPSYLIMQSLDKVNGLLFNGYADKIRKKAKQVALLKATLKQNGWILLDNDEPLKITLDAKANGYDGQILAKLLIQKSIMPEYFDPDYIVLMISAENDENDFATLERALKSIPRKEKIEKKYFSLKPISVISMKEALESPSETIDAQNAAGRILACPTVSCPPAVPVLYGGERIDEQAIEVFEYYGITNVKVVKIHK